MSTGNLYYYYYPVAAQPIVEKSDDDELDPLVLVLLPITLLIGVLALLSIFSKYSFHVSLPSRSLFFKMSLSLEDLSIPQTDLSPVSIRTKFLGPGTRFR